MPRIANPTVAKTLAFPMAGVARQTVYRYQARPYAAPWAVNVRGVGPLEHRQRGGSRPGLRKLVDHQFGDDITAILPVTSIDGDGDRNRDLIVVADGTFAALRDETVTVLTGELQTCEGVAIHTCEGVGEAIVFSTQTTAAHAVERNGKLFLADDVLNEYDPLTGTVEPVEATQGTIPTGCPLIALYRDRLFLAGTDQIWYASRQGDPGDWDFGADMNDSGRAVAGQVEQAGRIGDVIQAMIPRGDQALVFAARNELWLLRGDPTDGTLQLVSDGVGVLSPTAWAMSPEGTVAFLSNDGIYLMSAGSTEHPTRWSENRLPEQLRNIDPDENTIVMSHDVRGRGFNLFVTPATGTGQHWWLDTDNKALWPVRLPGDMQPVAAVRLQGQSGLAESILACRDGYLRVFDIDADDDDGEDIESHVLIGPVRLSSNDLTDAVLTEIHGMMADESGEVTWRVVAGNSAEVVTDRAVDGLDAALTGGAIQGVSSQGAWREGRNSTARPRARGPWAVIWLSARSAWAFEAVAVRARICGRIRHGY